MHVKDSLQRSMTSWCHKGDLTSGVKVSGLIDGRLLDVRGAVDDVMTPGSSFLLSCHVASSLQWLDKKLLLTCTDHPRLTGLKERKRGYVFQRQVQHKACTSSPLSESAIRAISVSLLYHVFISFGRNPRATRSLNRSILFLRLTHVFGPQPSLKLCDIACHKQKQTLANVSEQFAAFREQT